MEELVCLLSDGVPWGDFLPFGVAWLDLVAHELLGSVGHVGASLC